MAKTITKTKTGLNWGSEGIGGGIDTSSSNYTDTSFNAKATQALGLTTAGSRNIHLYKEKLIGANGTLITFKTHCTVRTDNTSQTSETYISEYQYDGEGIQTRVSEREEIGGTDTSITLTVNGSDIELYTYNGEVHDYYHLRLRAAPTGSSITSKTYNYYFTNVSFDLTYTVPAYTLTVTAGAGGTVTGGGDYETGTTATLTATPATGYKFVKWSDGNISATRTVTVSADKTYIATFAKINNVYTGSSNCDSIWLGENEIQSMWIGSDIQIY